MHRLHKSRKGPAHMLGIKCSAAWQASSMLYCLSQRGSCAGADLMLSMLIASASGMSCQQRPSSREICTSSAGPCACRHPRQANQQAAHSWTFALHLAHTQPLASAARRCPIRNVARSSAL